MNQTTIKNTVTFEGVGVHSGNFVSVTLKPAVANTGIVFIRTDVNVVENSIKALYENVSETFLGTTISNSSNIKVSTIEHLMAAIYHAKLDNLIVEINGSEVPVMDGSSSYFVSLFENAGFTTLSEKRKVIKILKEVSFQYKDVYILLSPSDSFSIDMSISFDSKAIKNQSIKFDELRSNFKRDIASARTFGFLKDLEKLKSMGLARGASLDNAIGIDEEGNVMNDNLRFKDEFVRHKVLDSIGDFYTSGYRITGDFICNKSGHQANNMLIRKIFDDNSNYVFV